MSARFILIVSEPTVKEKNYLLEHSVRLNVSVRLKVQKQVAVSRCHASTVLSCNIEFDKQPQGLEACHISARTLLRSCHSSIPQ